LSHQAIMPGPLSASLLSLNNPVHTRVLTASEVYRSFVAATSDALTLDTAPAAFEALPAPLQGLAALLKLWRVARAILKGPPRLDKRTHAAPPRQRPSHGHVLHAPWPRVSYMSNPDLWLRTFTPEEMSSMADALGAPPKVALRDMHDAPLPDARQPLGRLVFALESQERLAAWLALYYGCLKVRAKSGHGYVGESMAGGT
jgi:hypothetical protein